MTLGGVALGVLAVLLSGIDWETLARLGTPHAWGLLLVAALLQLLTVPVKAIAWRIALDAATPVTRIPLSAVLSPVFVGALFNMTLLGRAGEPVRLLLAASRLARSGRTVPMRLIFGSAVAESSVSTATWLALLMLAGLALPVPESVWILTVAFASVWLLVLVASGRRWGAGTGSVAAGRLRRLRGGLRQAWAGVVDAHRVLFRPSVAAALAAVCTAGWLLQWTSVLLILRAFDIDAGWRGATLVLVGVSLAQVAPLLPGNVGVFQAAVALPLVTAYDTTIQAAIAVGVVMQLVQVAPIALAGAVALAREGESLGDGYARVRGWTASRGPASA